MSNSARSASATPTMSISFRYTAAAKYPSTSPCTMPASTTRKAVLCGDFSCGRVISVVPMLVTAAKNVAPTIRRCITPPRPNSMSTGATARGLNVPNFDPLGDSTLMILLD